MSHNPPQATAFISISAAGLCSIGYGLTLAASWHPLEALTIRTCRGRRPDESKAARTDRDHVGQSAVRVPIAVAELNLAEALLVACA